MMVNEVSESAERQSFVEKPPEREDYFKSVFVNLPGYDPMHLRQFGDFGFIVY